MANTLISRLAAALAEIPIIDPHSHINPHQPAAKTLDDLLGYHYYTELAHSAGMSKEPLKEDVDPLERCKAILQYAERYDNTVQYSWLLEIAQTFFGWETDRLAASDADALWKAAEKLLQQPAWEEQVLKKSNVERIFLTNDFDDPLEGFDTKRYVPCLRVDDLVFKNTEPPVLERLAKATGKEIRDHESLGSALSKIFEAFVNRGARACAISLPPYFMPTHIVAQEFERAWKDKSLNAYFTRCSTIFYELVECCREWKLPIDLMIGVNRNIYQNGVYQGQDLFDQRTSLIQYAELFNAFPDVNFCISVLTSSQNQELASYSWIFPNVITSGHWWYSNVPTLIERDLRNRLQCVPKTKQIAYYSDAYKLEFILPKFNMYRKVLAKVLAEDFVLERRWSEDRAVDLGHTILRGNTERIFQV
jgi:glucuronate isomerase